MARILGIDVGERRIGIAVSTPEGGLAVPLRILESRGEEADIAAIIEIARAEGVEALVVGDPRTLAGEAGAQARRVDAFAGRLAEASGLPVARWDERLTSVQASRRPPGAGKRGSTGPADDVAAAIILQAYLDRERSRGR